MKVVTAFAPASVANVAVGFDTLGFAFGSLGDSVSIERVENPLPHQSVLIRSITGTVTDLPYNAEENTATLGLIKLRQDLGLKFGFNVSIAKGIPKGSGMGGSAASAVAAVVAANALLDDPLSRLELLPYALAGEYAASGAIHADNVGPCLLGGLQLISTLMPIKTVSLPLLKGMYCVIVHPDLVLETREARGVLKPTVELKDYVRQSAALASFVAASYRQDVGLMRSSMQDYIIEPQRVHLIQGFEKVKSIALSLGAIGAGISGSGPSIFAWAESEPQAVKIGQAIVEQFKKMKLNSQAWVGEISADGARIIQ